MTGDVGDIGSEGDGIVGVVCNAPLLCCSTLGDGGGDVFDAVTLGDASVDEMVELLCTLIDSARFSCVANSNSAFRTGSPADKDGVVDDGGLVSSSMISSAACLR